MKIEYGHRNILVWMSLLGLILLAACSKSDEVMMEDGVPVVRAQFNFSLPLKGTMSNTRMGGTDVQEAGTPGQFRGMTDVNLFCYNSATEPTQTTKKIGNIIEINSLETTVTTDITTDYSMCQEIKIPVTTSYFGFYARANDAPSTHNEKMRYGIVEAVGLSKGSYVDNSSIHFIPVPICNSDEDFGGSLVGPRLLALLNDLMSTTVAEAAPNDKWATVNDIYLNEAYQRMIALKAMSSSHVELLLAAINRILYLESPDHQGDALRQALINKIAGYCTVAPTPTSATITLKDDYQGYPIDIHLPAGAARVEWDAEQEKFVVPATHSYGTAINVASLQDYVYPMNLQYQVLSTIKASDEKVIMTDTPSTTYDSWNKVLTEGYAGADNSVQNSTQSIAMVEQVNYAVGRLNLATRIAANRAVKDAKGNTVDLEEHGFTLKGYLIGGQREVGYDFQPIAGTKAYTIYDSYLLNGNPISVDNRGYSDTDYILGLGTDSNQKINMALELVNESDDFWGEDGLIAHGATFYLVAVLDPNPSGTATTLNKVFDRDYYTTVNLTITSLAKASYGLPNLDIPHPTVGVSVNLSWEDGLWFDDVELKYSR